MNAVRTGEYVGTDWRVGLGRKTLGFRISLWIVLSSCSFIFYGYSSSFKPLLREYDVTSIGYVGLDVCRCFGLGWNFHRCGI